MNPFKNRVVAKPAEPAEGIAALAGRAADALAQAVAVDAELATLMARLPQLRQMHADAKATLEDTVGRFNAWLNAPKQRNVSAEAEALLSVTGSTTVAPVTAEEIAAARHRVAVTVEAIALGEAKIRNRRHELARQIAHEMVLPALRPHVAKCAETLVRLVVETAAVQDTLIDLGDAGFGVGVVGPVWTCVSMLDVARDPRGPGACLLRESVEARRREAAQQQQRKTRPDDAWTVAA